ncbi:MAG: hypothetical protein H7061_09020 [Bdellovibrionaceae bacterium]|nr:hypothetical protein [Bdellovibrio sp.]
MKLRHLVLFIISCGILIISEFPAGSLVALAMLFQLNLLLNRIPLTKNSQWAAFRLFLFSIPVFFFWGGIHSFTQIYLSEGQIIFFVMALLVSLMLSALVALQAVLAFHYLLEAQFKVGVALQFLFNDIKNKKNQLFKTTGLVFLFSYVPLLSTDWKLIFAVLTTQIILNWVQLKPALALRL